MTELTEAWINIYKHKRSYWCGTPNHTKSEALLHLADTENYLTTVNIEQLLKLQEENAQLKSKLQLKETSYDFDTARLEDENKNLKELLKECRSPINYALCLNLSEEEKIEFKNLLAKIKKVLGEE